VIAKDVIVNDEILKKLEQRVNRRSFLRGSSLAAAAVIGVAAFPLASFAQDPQKPDETNDAKKDEKADENASGDGNQKDAAKKDPNAPVEDEFKVTKKDENGREYRICPQCGYNMYRQDRTWTCENCGYSYTE